MGMIISLPLKPIRGHSYFHVMGNIKTYEKQFSARYEASYMWFFVQNIKKEINKKVVPNKWQLPQRNWYCFSKPLKQGELFVLSKHGGKKWKKRYCVLLSDYTFEIYKSKEDYESGMKAKASTKYSGYVVTGDVDGHLQEKLTIAGRDFGYVNPDTNAFGRKVTLIGLAGPRPTQHVFLVDHPWRGIVYFAAETAIEKDQWLKFLRDAVLHLEGCQCNDEVGREAFAFAVEQSVRLQEFFVDRSMLSGTQQEILTDLISAFQSVDCREVLIPRMTGGIANKYKAWCFVLSSIHNLIHGVVAKQYITWRRVCEERCHQKREQIVHNLPEINAAYDVAAKAIRATLAQCFDPVLRAKVLPLLPKVINTMSDSLVSPIRAAREMFKSLVEGIMKQLSESTQFANNIDQLFVNELDFAPRNPEFTCPSGDTLSHTSAQVAFLESIFPRTDFNIQLRRVYTYQQQVLDSAVYTFESLCGDAVLENDGKLSEEIVTKIQNQVLKKLDYDIILAQKRFFRDILLCGTMECARESIEQHCKPKMLDFEATIPEDFRCYLPINNLFTEVLTNRFIELINPVLSSCMTQISGDTTKTFLSSDNYGSEASLPSIESIVDRCGNFGESPSFMVKRNSVGEQVDDGFTSFTLTPVDASDVPSTSADARMRVDAEDGVANTCRDSESGECGDMDGETGEWFPQNCEIIEETNDEEEGEEESVDRDNHSKQNVETTEEVSNTFTDSKPLVKNNNLSYHNNDHPNSIFHDAPQRILPGNCHSNFTANPGNTCRANCASFLTDSGEPSPCICNGISDDAAGMGRCIMTS